MKNDPLTDTDVAPIPRALEAMSRPDLTDADVRGLFRDIFGEGAPEVVAAKFVRRFKGSRFESDARVWARQALDIVRTLGSSTD